MSAEASQIIRILHDSDVGAARRTARTLAENLGFDPIAREEVALAVIELATNLVKYAQDGQLTLTALAEDGRVGVEVVSADRGPGIPDVDQALANRFSTSGTRGTGLGAVNRLMDEFDIRSRPGTGTRIICRKWRRDYAASAQHCPLAIGAATRPRTMGDVNGDAFVIRHWAGSMLAGVIDGLGHGQFAHRASQAARQYVESHFDQPLEQIFRGTARACGGTRGVVMALARFDWALGHVSVASVGNVELRVCPPSRALDFPVRRRVLGLNAPAALVTRRPWNPQTMLIMHSDGLRSHWRWEEFPELPRQTASAAAERLLRALAKEQDDATVLVVKEAQP